ncbi:MAG: hypothetical protein FD145_1506 [Candidatus Saganbacteria bacterium]|uniref:Uncharacterized protein n=1 Tax=Candidatus Saganbacteria bacterium TaxID=2575572 RepID=A0A833L036_UNCSA|nr:MAG: hypothetical protein FD145_1506 [Candidatus Saganbacteria bacterium]
MNKSKAINIYLNPVAYEYEEKELYCRSCWVWPSHLKVYPTNPDKPAYEVSDGDIIPLRERNRIDRIVCIECGQEIL